MRKTQEQVIRRFYKQFEQERYHFLAALSGIEESREREHYASLLLYRLLFLAFLQQRGFLAGNPRYLFEQFQQTQERYGPDTFYHHFLLPLFHEGLSKAQRTPELLARLGSVPFLGSNFFAPHAIEQRYPTLHLPDQGFQRLFAFFDTYEWQLDASASASGTKDVINPDILGHILEQYVNQQQMGAYYTHDDVTSYIARYTLLPYLLQKVAQQAPEAFSPSSPHWQLLRTQPERYLYAEMGCQRELPGETAQEYTQRQARYTHLLHTLKAGEIHTFDACITHNLDIQLFALDLLTVSFPLQLVRTFYAELCQVSILDPTCGSGAFLFAALNVLEPLYEACLLRLSGPISVQQKYSLLKAIITRNLYGVDLMEEAIEICTLRFFLKLLAQLQGVEGIEPLPALQQNLHVGNALVGYVHAPANYPNPQTPRELDYALATAYGVDPADDEAFARWCASHQPLHWWATFPEIQQQGGFSVILGNPPYVEYEARKFAYRLPRYETAACANLYPCIIERSVQLLAPDGRQGMILPLAAFATRNMLPFLRGFKRWFSTSWLSFYHFRPAMLFGGHKIASIPTAIYLASASGPEQRFSTHIRKWSTEQRPALFPTLAYSPVTVNTDAANPHYYPKFGHASENAILAKLLRQETIERYLSPQPNQNCMYYRSAGGLYWKVFINFPWPYHTTSNKYCSFQAPYHRDVFVALLNSSLFWWYYTVTFDTFNLKDYMLFGFRFTYPQDPQVVEALCQLCEDLMQDYRHNALHRRRGQTGSYTVYAKKAKPIIDAIDALLAQHYGMTEEELTFIRTYDLKYRLGSEEQELLPSR